MTTPIGCEEALRMLATFLDGELESGDAGSVQVHLETCRSCYSRAEFERRLRSRLAELGTGLDDADLTRRIQDVIHRLAGRE